MRRLDLWHRRPLEEAAHFNPAFLCVLTHEFLRDYCKAHAEGAPITIVIVALSACLHRATRDRLPLRTVTPVYKWLQDNEDVKVGFATRTKNLSPFIKEAVLFGMATKTLSVADGHNLITGQTKASFPSVFIDDTTAELRAINHQVKFMGRWLSNSGSETAILAAWGVKP